ncbi:MAG: hypothetical protein ABIS01_01910, partial [Ferruginibacter sp.]
KINPSEVFALIKFKNGKTEKKEFYNGSSFLSQSARFLSIDNNVSSVIITDDRNNERKLDF